MAKNKKEEEKIQEEIDRLSRKTNIQISRAEQSFNNQLKKLDAEMDKLLEDKVSDFDDAKELTQKYLDTDFSEEETIKRYRRKLKKI